MVLDKLFGRFKQEKGEEGPDTIEIDPSVLSGEQKVNVRIELLKDFNDTDRVQQLVREGNVVFLKIRELREKNISELKRCVDRLKKTAVANGGDIVGIEEDFLVLTPNFARIYRGAPAV